MRIRAKDVTTGADIPVDLRFANLIGASLTKADLVEADFTGAYLVNTNLSSAQLNQAKFVNTTLLLVILNKANLTDADFTGATLSEVNLKEVDLTGVDLSKTRGLLTTNFLSAKGLTPKHLPPEVITAMEQFLRLMNKSEPASA